MNRGSPARCDDRECDEDPSMRPRFMNRGSQRRGSVPVVSAVPFNEAPIHESGKCSDSTLRPSAAHTFNEAPIHESGKSRQRTFSISITYTLQ